VLRRALIRLEREVGYRRIEEYPEPDLRRPCVVVSPHQDDETLGCGGAIAAKRRAGAPVRIVFLMDGSISHKSLIAADELRAIRREEAIAAAHCLGVGHGDVTFLDFPEGKLAGHREAAVRGLREVFDDTEPEEIFVPSPLEPQRDHHEANAVTRLAVGRRGLPVTLTEYPVWCWYHWPRVPLPFSRWSSPPPLKRLQEARRIVATTRAMSFGTRIYREFSCRLDVSGELDQKRAALAEYRSQTTRLLPDPRWATLGDVGGGAFLDALLQPFELFHRCELEAGAPVG
jgi:LmbE family N-acetylglucosaminyl deacetylase